MGADLYLRVRQREGRIYSDELVARLPALPHDHPLAREWRARSVSAKRLNDYLSRRSKPLDVLDLGCGNGWLSSLLSRSGHHVIGLDQNHNELQQAARVFSANGNPYFIEANIFAAPLRGEAFDTIVIASAIQYFPNLRALAETLTRYLKPGGEIYIADSPFYSDNDLDLAVLRSRRYYSSLGFPKMAEEYFHHQIAELKAFKPIVLYQPNPILLRVKNWLGYIDSPFPVISIYKPDI